MTRARDVADTQENNGGGVAPFVAGKNKIINGDFSVFQRTSFTSQTVAAYSLDRWYAGLGGTVTVSQQTTGAPVGSQYVARMAYNAASSYCNMFQALEAGTAKTLAGQTITVSILVRANAAWASTAGQGINLIISKNSTANTLTGGSWTQIAAVGISAASIPTGTGAADWYKLSTTVAIPNDGTAAGLRMSLGEIVVGPSGAYWEMAQAQLEVGNVATPFTTATGTVQGELAACQRYYYRSTPGITNGLFATGSALITTDARYAWKLPVTMRIIPTAVDYAAAAKFRVTDGVNAPASITSISLITGVASQDIVQIYTSGSSGLTAFRPYYLEATATDAFIGVTAEL